MSVPRAGAVVLAGGRSTRMGEDKAALDWGGVPLLQHVVRVVSEGIEGGPVIVVGRSCVRSGVYSTPNRTHNAIEDANPGRGPLEGIATGLERLASQAPVAIVASVDLPFLSPDLARALIHALGDTHDAALARDPEGRTHPLAAAYRTTIAGQARALLDQGERRASALAATVRTTFVDTDTQTLLNVNTPADLERARRLG